MSLNVVGGRLAASGYPECLIVLVDRDEEAERKRDKIVFSWDSSQSRCCGLHPWGWAGTWEHRLTLPSVKSQEQERRKEENAGKDDSQGSSLL